MDHDEQLYQMQEEFQRKAAAMEQEYKKDLQLIQGYYFTIS